MNFLLVFCHPVCHPLIFPAALCPLSCSMLCCILASASCIPLYITDVISLYCVNYWPWVIFLPFLFCSRLPSLLWSGPSPSLLTFGSLFADLQHIYLTQCLFLFLISSNSSFFPLFLLPNNSFLLFFHAVPTMITACSPSWGPRLGMGPPEPPAKGATKISGHIWLLPGWKAVAKGGGWWLGLLGGFGWPWHGSRAHAPDLCSLSPHLSLLVLPSSLDNYHPCHLPFLITPWMLKLSLHHSDLSLISSIRFYFPFCRSCGYCCPLLPFMFLLLSLNGSLFLFVHTSRQKIRMSFFFFSFPLLFLIYKQSLSPCHVWQAIFKKHKSNTCLQY